MEIVFTFNKDEERFLKELNERDGKYSMNKEAGPSNRDLSFRLRWQKQIDELTKFGLLKLLPAYSSHQVEMFGLSALGVLAFEQIDPCKAARNFLKKSFSKSNHPMLHGKTLEALKNAGIRNGDELLACSEQDLLGHRGLGTRKIDELNRMLKPYGETIRK